MAGEQREDLLSAMRRARAETTAAIREAVYAQGQLKAAGERYPLKRVTRALKLLREADPHLLRALRDAQ